MTRRTYDPNLPAFSNALDALRPELAAIPADQLEKIRLEIVPAILCALGVSTRVKGLRADVAVALGEEDARQIDRLETAARACGRAHALHLTTLHGTDVEEMAEELSQKRRVLLLEAQSLVNEGRLARSVLGELAGGTGYQAMCLDVLQLVSAFRADFAAIAEATAVTTVELDRAEALANALASTLGDNGQATSTSSPTAELRQRAYTSFVRNYDEVRRAIIYLRWDAGDADEIAPSLFAGRRSRKNDDEEDDPVVTTTTPNDDAPVSPGLPGAPPFVTP
jgi:hypothetical protein